MGARKSFVGTSLAGYLLSTEIASNHASCLYLGQSASANDEQPAVALKYFYAHPLETQEEQERFLQEVQFLQTLSPSYNVPLLTFGVEENIPYLVTEYEPNSSLADRMQGEQPLTPEEALALISRVGYALSYAHMCSVVHGNLTPRNVLFSGRGKPLLIDYRLSSLVGKDCRSEPSTYQAPEQLQGVFEPAGDQYALACIAYELLTGGSLALDRTDPPIAPRWLNPGLSIAVEAALLKALEHDPAERYPDMLDFLSALGLLLNQESEGQAKSPLPVPVNMALEEQQRLEIARAHHSEPTGVDLNFTSLLTRSAVKTQSASKYSSITILAQATFSRQIFSVYDGGINTGYNPRPVPVRSFLWKRSYLLIVAALLICILGGLFFTLFSGMLSPHSSSSVLIPTRQVQPQTAFLAVPPTTTPSPTPVTPTPLPSPTATPISISETQPVYIAPTPVLHPGAPQPTPIPQPIHQTLVDNLNDWSQVYSHTQNLGLDQNNSQWMSGDTSLVVRSPAGKNEEIVWHLSNVTSFVAVTYFWPSETVSPFSVLVSSNGVTWSAVSPNISGTPGNWSQYIYSVNNLSGVNYVKMRWNNLQGNSWSPQIGAMTLKS